MRPIQTKSHKYILLNFNEIGKHIRPPIDGSIILLLFSSHFYFTQANASICSSVLWVLPLQASPVVPSRVASAWSAPPDPSSSTAATLSAGATEKTAYYDEGEHEKVLPHAACLCLMNVKRTRGCLARRLLRRRCTVP